MHHAQGLGIYGAFVQDQEVLTCKWAPQRNRAGLCHAVTPCAAQRVRRCVSMLAHLYHAEEVCGTATVGSSEAILLGGLAMKRRWQARARSGPRLPGG